VLALSIYFGLLSPTPINGAANIALFVGWAYGTLGVLSGIALFLDPDDIIKKTTQKTDWAVPLEVDLVIDVCFLLAYIWSGHWVLGTFYMIAVFVFGFIRYQAKIKLFEMVANQDN